MDSRSIASSGSALEKTRSGRDTVELNEAEVDTAVAVFDGESEGPLDPEIAAKLRYVCLRLRINRNVLMLVKGGRLTSM